jgi:hypothetical protein
MAGMFYSLQETAQKLKKSEDEVKQFIKDGKIRVFYDGPNPLFKIDEVEALVSKSDSHELEQLALADDSQGVPAKPAPKKPAPSKEGSEKKPDDSIFLADETASKGDVLNADTAILGDGLNLEGTGTGADKLEDLLAETKEGGEAVPAGSKGDEDLGLDTFGSGGLLDVSLQADDTSLGGILDEIYTSQGEEGQAPEGENIEMAIQGEVMTEPRHGPVEPALSVMPAYVEPAPDTMSNAFGLVLFIPFFATILTLIIASVGSLKIMPSFLNKLKSNVAGVPLVWYIAAIACIIALLIIAGGAVFNPDKIKTKKVKEPKPPKEKKVIEKKIKEKKPKEKKK